MKVFIMLRNGYNMKMLIFVFTNMLEYSILKIRFFLPYYLQLYIKSCITHTYAIEPLGFDFLNIIYMVTITNWAFSQHLSQTSDFEISVIASVNTDPGHNIRLVVFSATQSLRENEFNNID